MQNLHQNPSLSDLVSSARAQISCAAALLQTQVVNCTITTLLMKPFGIVATK
jgi:hypothetical protein